MINLFFESIFFLLASCTIILSLAGYGNFLVYKYNNNFFEKIFLGIIIITFLVTLIHFFFKISFYIAIGLLFIGLILFLRNHKSFLTKLYKSNLLYLIIFLILLPIYISQKYHEDFGYYHLPYVITMTEEKIIFGLANSNSAYVHNSIWLNTISLFSLPKNNFNFLTLPSYLIYNLFIIFSLKNILKFNDQKISNYFLIICVFYLILKFTRISEYGNDLPAIIFSILTIFYFLRYSETKKNQNKFIYFFCCFSFAIFSILIKFSCIPIFLLPIYLYLKNFNFLKKEIFKLNYFFLYLVALIFFIQQFIYTGCFIFPSTISCLDVSWFNNEFIDAKSKLELVNKSYSIARNIFSPQEYLNNFTWFPYWLSRNYTEILEHIITMLLPMIILFLFSKQAKKNEKIDIIFFDKYIFVIFILLGFTFWLTFSPVYRFGVIYFISLIFFTTYFFYKTRIISKKPLIYLFLLALFFNQTKNILRISNQENIFLGIKKINNTFFEYTISKNDYILVLGPDSKNNKKNGWQGILCWDISFLCSYNEINVRKINNYLFLKKIKTN